MATLLLSVQIILGAWVAANHAGGACQGFPQCNGQWWPQANFKSALDITYGLFSGYRGDLAFDAQVGINCLHRLGALSSFIVLTLLMFRSMSTTAPKPVRKAGLWLSVLLFIEIASALLGFKLNMPLWLSVTHQLGAALLMLPLIAIGFYSRYSFQDVTEAATLVPEIKPADVVLKKTVMAFMLSQMPVLYIYALNRN